MFKNSVLFKLCETVVYVIVQYLQFVTEHTDPINLKFRRVDGSFDR